MDKLWYIHIVGYYSMIRGNKLVVHADNMANSQIHYAKWKKPVQDYILLFHLCEIQEKAELWR